MEEGQPERHVLVVDDDRDVADVVAAILGDEGYRVTVVDPVSDEAVLESVGRIEPDCILLDGSGAAEYGSSWAMAGALSARQRSIPLIMFTAHPRDASEAEADSSARSHVAGFAAVLRKPFELDELLQVVDRATRRSIPFNHSAAAEQRRTDELVARLTAAGARDVRSSSTREWATFIGPDESVLQLYWWQSEGRYLVARYADDGGRIDLVGRYLELDEAIAAALSGS